MKHVRRATAVLMAAAVVLVALPSVHADDWQAKGALALGSLAGTAPDFAQLPVMQCTRCSSPCIRMRLQKRPSCWHCSPQW